MDIYHPITPDIRDAVWPPGSCFPPRKQGVEAIKVPKVTKETAFAKWLQGTRGANRSDHRHMQVPGEIINLREDICSCPICPCGCYIAPNWNTYFIEMRGGTYVHDECGEVVSMTEFFKWLKQAKVENPEATRLQVPGELIYLDEHICSCPICTCGCYVSRGGPTYFIEKRNGVFVHDHCGEAVE